MHSNQVTEFAENTGSSTWAKAWDNFDDSQDAGTPIKRGMAGWRPGHRTPEMYFRHIAITSRGIIFYIS